LANIAELNDLLNLLKSKGKIRFWGVSCFQPDEAIQFAGLAGCDLIQLPTHIRYEAILPTVVNELQRLNVAIVGRQPFAHGRVLRDIAEGYPDQSMAIDAALRFALHDSPVNTILIGTSSCHHDELIVSACGLRRCSHPLVLYSLC